MMDRLDRRSLDELVPHRPVRVQHRSGAVWILNTAALRQLSGPLPEGASRDPAGEPDGWFVREDEWLRRRLPAADRPDLREVLAALHGTGVTSVTDMTPFADVAQLQVLAKAVAGSRLEVTASGAQALTTAAFPTPLSRGPVEVFVDETDPPDFDDFSEWIAEAHRHAHPVAVHCVTRTALAMTIAALEAVGARPGDRIEHGSDVPPELVPALRALVVTVVTQPGFIHARGDQYRDVVPADDLLHLWPCASLLAAGIPVGGSSDAPFGPVDPWLAIDTAVSRLTESGETVGAWEAVDTLTALSMGLTSPDDPGGRRVALNAERPHACACPTDL